MTIIESIYKTAFELFMKYGVKSVSMDDIAGKLGMSKKTIYSEIENKESLITRVIQGHLENEVEKITEITKLSNDAIEEMVKISHHVMSSLNQMKPSLIYDLRKYYPKCWKMIEEIHFTFIKKVIESNIKRGQQEGLYRPETNPMIIAKLYVSMTQSIVNEEIFSLSTFDIVDLSRQMKQYHMHGIVTNEGKIKLNQLTF